MARRLAPGAALIALLAACAVSRAAGTRGADQSVEGRGAAGSRTRQSSRRRVTAVPHAITKQKGRSSWAASTPGQRQALHGT